MEGKIFNYNLEKLNTNYPKVISSIIKYRGISKDIPKVYFVIKKENNQIVYIGSSKYCLFTRIYCHINESINMVRVYDELGYLRPQSNDYKKTRTFCDLIYNLDEFEVIVFGEYKTLKDAEIAEKTLIYYCSNFNFNVNLCNSVGTKSLSTIAIKKSL